MRESTLIVLGMLALGTLIVLTFLWGGESKAELPEIGTSLRIECVESQVIASNPYDGIVTVCTEWKEIEE